MIIFSRLTSRSLSTTKKCICIQRVFKTQQPAHICVLMMPCSHLEAIYSSGFNLLTHRRAWFNMPSALILFYQGLTRSHSVSQGLTRSYEVSQGVTRSFEVSQGVTRSYKVLRGFTGSHKVLRGLTRCHKVLQGLTRSHEVLQSLTRSHKV